MPLKIITRGNSKTFYIRGTVRGQSVFESTGTTNAEQAEAYRAKREAELWTESVYGKRATVTFAHAVAAYMEAEPRTETTRTHLRRLLAHFGTTKLESIGQQELDDAYKAILTKGAQATGATKLRAVLTPLRAVLEFAAIRGWCNKPAFQRPKVQQVRMQFLRPARGHGTCGSSCATHPAFVNIPDRNRCPYVRGSGTGMERRGSGGEAGSGLAKAGG